MLGYQVRAGPTLKPFRRLLAKSGREICGNKSCKKQARDFMRVAIKVLTENDGLCATKCGHYPILVRFFTFLHYVLNRSPTPPSHLYYPTFPVDVLKL